MSVFRATLADDAAALAALHAQAFDRPWPEAEIAAVMAGPGAFGLMVEERGFILCRAIAGEAEILTLAVAPAARRTGVGRALVEAAVGLAATRGAFSLFLEVAHDNPAALALYDSAGFQRVGLRRGYYAHGADAVVMSRPLNT
jgi:ribosomal-protein-alanine N-acetyltransferase